MADRSQSPQDTATTPQASGTGSKLGLPAQEGRNQTHVHRPKNSASRLIFPFRRRTPNPKSHSSLGLSRTLSAASNAAKAAAKITIRRSQDILHGRKSVLMDSGNAQKLDASAPYPEVAELPATDLIADNSHSIGRSNEPNSFLSVEAGQKRKHPDDNADPSSSGAPKPKSRSTGAVEISRSKQSIEEKDNYILDWMGNQRNAISPNARLTWSPEVVSLLEPSSTAIYGRIQGGDDGHVPINQSSSPPLHLQMHNQRASAPTGQAGIDPRMRVIREARQNRFHYPDPQSKSSGQPALYYRKDSYSSQTSAPSRSDSFPPVNPQSDLFGHDRHGSTATLATNSGTVSDSMSTKRWSSCTSATTITNAASPDLLFAQTKRSLTNSHANSPLSRPTGSPQPSIRNISRVRKCASVEFDHNGQKSPPPVPALPSNINDLPVTILFDNASSFSVISQVLKAGDHAKQRRQEFLGDTIIDPVAASEVPCHTNSLPCPIRPECQDGLSVIDEHGSDAESYKAWRLLRPDDEEMADRETATPTSRQVTIPSSYTSGTSVDDSPEPEGSNADGSDNDTASDLSDHTDVSLLDAFYSHRTPFGSDLLSILFSVKEVVVACIRQQVQSTVQHNDAESRHHGEQASSNSTALPQSSDGQSSSRKRDGNKKRPFSEDEEGDGPDRGDGDGDKRQRPNPTAQATILPPIPKKRFACPFYKRYSKRDWFSKACYGPGFSSVHRVK